MIQRYELRKLTLELGDEISKLPVVFRGTHSACTIYAKQHGYKWKKSENIFGGYFVNAKGECLMPT